MGSGIDGVRPSGTVTFLFTDIEGSTRKTLGATTSFARGAKPGTWILTGGGSALPVREKADVSTGTWKAATWEQDG